MKFNEAITNISTTSTDVKGVPKRAGSVVRRPLPAGYIADIRGSDEEDDDDTWKDFYKKQKRQDEGRRITRDDRPSYDHSDMRNFWKGSEDGDEDEEELEELFMQLSGAFNDIAMEPHWKKGRKYAPDDEEDEKDEKDEEGDEKKQEGVWTNPVAGSTSWTDPNFGEKAIAPFWRKGKQYVDPEDDEEDPDEA